MAALAHDMAHSTEYPASGSLPWDILHDVATRSLSSTGQLTADVKTEACVRCFYGFMPYWVAAVVVSCCDSFLTVSGFILQKKAIQAPGARTLWPSVGDVVFSPQWALGFLLAIVLPLPGNLVAYALAPMSLIAPLSGFTILVNFVMAPLLLGERLQPLPDITASVLILLGMVLTTMTGDHGGDAVAMDLDRMRHLLAHEGFLMSLVCLAVAMVSGLVYMYLRREAIEEAAAVRPSNPPLHHLLLPAVMYAGFGCLTNISLKAVAELIASGVPLIVCGLAALVLIVPVACLQLNFLNRGLRLYLQVIFFPVSSAALLITNTVYGTVYYQEYSTFVHDPLNLVIFVIGVIFIAIGINTFQLRKNLREASPAASLPVSDLAELTAPHIMLDLVTDRGPATEQGHRVEKSPEERHVASFSERPGPAAKAKVQTRRARSAAAGWWDSASCLGVLAGSQASGASDMRHCIRET